MDSESDSETDTVPDSRKRARPSDSSASCALFPGVPCPFNTPAVIVSIIHVITRPRRTIHVMSASLPHGFLTPEEFDVLLHLNDKDLTEQPQLARNIISMLRNTADDFVLGDRESVKRYTVKSGVRPLSLFGAMDRESVQDNNGGYRIEHSPELLFHYVFMD
jgi:hypothetical protein